MRVTCFWQVKSTLGLCIHCLFPILGPVLVKWTHVQFSFLIFFMFLSDSHRVFFWACEEQVCIRIHPNLAWIEAPLPSQGKRKPWIGLKRREEKGVKRCLTAHPLLLPDDFSTRHPLSYSLLFLTRKYKGLVMGSWGLLHAAAGCHSKILSPHSPFILTLSYTTFPSSSFLPFHTCKSLLWILSCWSKADSMLQMKWLGVSEPFFPHTFPTMSYNFWDFLKPSVWQGELNWARRQGVNLSSLFFIPNTTN